MQYGLMMANHELIHRDLTRRLSTTLSFEDIYLALAIEDEDHDFRPAKIDDTGRSIAVPLPAFLAAMHQEESTMRMIQWIRNTFPLPLQAR